MPPAARGLRSTVDWAGALLYPASVVRPPPRAWVPLVLAALGAVSCAPVDTTSSYELSGIVSERFESGMVLAPLGGVAVTFVSDTGLATATTSGSDGRYRMLIESDTPFGTVRAVHPEFQDRTENVYFDTPIRRIDLDMRRPE